MLDSSSPPRADAEVSVAFLKRLRSPPWVLTAITPDGPTTTATAHSADAVRKFIAKHNDTQNVYYAVNPLRATTSKKAAKVDVAAVEFALADLDPEDNESPEAAKRRYASGLTALAAKPTAAVDSGNGIQGLWRLDPRISLGEPVVVERKRTFSPEDQRKIDDVEARTRALMLSLGSKAGTQNIDRILRLPGTINHPNAKKRKLGRVPCETKLLWFDDTTYALDAFPLPAAEEASRPGTPEDGGHHEPQAGSEQLSLDALPVSKRIKNLIRGIDHAEHPYDSRSERVLAVLIAMAATDCADGQMEFVFDKFPIGEHVREQGNPARYLRGQIAKARKLAQDADVAKLNESYALVLIGDKTAILKTDEGVVRLLTVSAFEQWHANHFVMRGDQRLVVAKHWLRHRQRRQYDGLVFAPGRDTPGRYNLWRGFAVKPQPGDCSKFLAHLRDNVACGNEDRFRWLVGWFASIVQAPDRKSGTALVLRGKQGTGKTKVGEVIGSLLGDHYALVSDPRYITGRFNSHLVACLLLHADESFWAGDHAAEGKLKDLVTGDHQFIEYKGKEPIRVRNFVRLFVTGNPSWLVPAGFEERRFAVLDMGEGALQDHAYFAAIDEEMNSGGREALLEHLLKFDLKSVDLRAIPKTAALLEQKLASLTPEQGWWLDVLNRGQLPWGCEEGGRCPTRRLFDGYIRHASRHGARRRAIEVQLGVFLNKHVPGLRKTDATYKVWSASRQEMSDVRGNIYVFPSLGECRARFATEMQQNIAWAEPDDWAHEPPPDGPEEAI
jgi:hypothetical protein